MSWIKPQRHWQRLLLLTPALELMFIPFVAKQWGRFLFPHTELPEVALLFNNLFLALALSLALGIWQAWPLANWPKRIATGLVLGIGIAIINGTIAFAGCAAGGWVFEFL
jgi:hypothetical protein